MLGKEKPPGQTAFFVHGVCNGGIILTSKYSQRWLQGLFSWTELSCPSLISQLFCSALLLDSHYLFSYAYSRDLKTSNWARPQAVPVTYLGPDLPQDYTKHGCRQKGTHTNTALIPLNPSVILRSCWPVSRQRSEEAWLLLKGWSGKF